MRRSALQLQKRFRDRGAQKWEPEIEFVSCITQNGTHRRILQQQRIGSGTGDCNHELENGNRDQGPKTGTAIPTPHSARTVASLDTN
jgi:hypothetical protein